MMRDDIERLSLAAENPARVVRAEDREALARLIVWANSRPDHMADAGKKAPR